MADAFDGKQYVIPAGKDPTTPESKTNPVQADSSGNLMVSLGTTLALERGVGTANAYGVTIPEYGSKFQFNPRAASTGSTKGAAGTAGLNEVVVSSVPCTVGGVFFEGDSTGAKGVLLRDAAATGASSVAIYLSAGLVAPNAGATAPTQFTAGIPFSTGLTVCGDESSVAAVIIYRAKSS